MWDIKSVFMFSFFFQNRRQYSRAMVPVGSCLLSRMSRRRRLLLPIRNRSSLIMWIVLEKWLLILTQLSGGVYVLSIFGWFAIANVFYFLSTILNSILRYQDLLVTILAIQGSSVASERSFSSGALTDTLYRNRMEPFLFGRVQIAKQGYKCRLLDASTDAEAHPVREYIQVL